ncbi:putative DNA polymerase [Peptoniphilus sp. ING2-D1G]|nr:putative DNA polymerase [Peptoniphilus sp. ING2-D1G]
MDFVGNREVLKELENNLLSGEINHTYLFTGSEGVGKFTAAKAFASRILEPERKDIIYREDYEHEDLKIVRSEDSIKKSQIEELIIDSKLTPFNSKYKVFIIDGIEKVTISAQNSMLKMLEEPENFLKIILISSSTENILPTIISRSRVVKFRDIDRDELKNFLMRRESISEKNADLFSRISAGSVKRALRFARDPHYLMLRDKSIEVLDRLINVGNYPFRDMDFFKNNIDNLKEIFVFFDSFLRDVVIYRDENIREKYLINIDKKAFLEKQSISAKRAVEISNDLLLTKKLIKENTNFNLAIEELLINIGGIR